MLNKNATLPYIALLALSVKYSVILILFAFSDNLSAENSKLSAESWHCGHHLLGCMANWFKIWSSGDVPCNVSKVGHQVACIATLPWIALLALSVNIELVSSSARVTSVKSTQGLGVTDIRTHRSDPRFTWVR